MSQTGEARIVRASWGPLNSFLKASPYVIPICYKIAEEKKLKMPLTLEQCLELFKSIQDVVALLDTPIAELKKKYGTFRFPLPFPL